MDRDRPIPISVAEGGERRKIGRAIGRNRGGFPFLLALGGKGFDREDAGWGWLCRQTVGIGRWNGKIAAKKTAAAGSMAKACGTERRTDHGHQQCDCRSNQKAPAGKTLANHHFSFQVFININMLIVLCKGTKGLCQALKKRNGYLLRISVPRVVRMQNADGVGPGGRHGAHGLPRLCLSPAPSVRLRCFTRHRNPGTLERGRSLAFPATYAAGSQVEDEPRRCRSDVVPRIYRPPANLLRRASEWRPGVVSRGQSCRRLLSIPRS